MAMPMPYPRHQMPRRKVALESGPFDSDFYYSHKTMNKAGNLLNILLKDGLKLSSRIQNFHSGCHNLRQRQNVSFEKYFDNANIQSSLWFTNLPSRRKRTLSLAERKKFKLKMKKIPVGPLVISCKRPEFNHYKGNQYGKFDVIPLASKSWYHRKSNGDHFTILATTGHPAFKGGEFEKIPNTFEETGLSQQVIEKLKKVNAECPTTIQAKSIPAILEGNSVLITAETGCGKTLAYLAPIVQNILHLKKIANQELLVNTPLAVILTPTKELAIQIGMVAHKLCSDLGIVSLTLLGGKTNKMLLNPVMETIDILVCTPGVFSKMVFHNIYSMQLCKYFVLDEADTLLDDSFNNKLKSIVYKSKLKFGLSDLTNFDNCQLCLVSATMPTSIDTILENIIEKENLIKISSDYLHKIQSHIPQEFLKVGVSRKPELLLKILKNRKKIVPTMIFSNKTATSNWVNHFLNENGIKSIRINALMRHEARLQQYQLFREGMVDVICCTDIASRGLDSTRVKHVINYEFPKFVADYIHRSGRTGRIGHEDNCLVTSFISRKHELPLLHAIEKAARTSFQLENVNNNISRILKYRFQKKLSASV